MNAHDILQAAAGHMSDRAATYDRPQGERSMGATVGAFLAVSGISLTEEQGWLFMALLKAVRSQQGAYRADSYEDGAAYFALAGEAAALTRAAPHAQTVPSPRTADIEPATSGQQNVFEPASEIDDESDRIQAIGQNGNSGEHYDAEKLERWKRAPKDATHWGPETEMWEKSFYKFDGASLYFYDGSDWFLEDLIPASTLADRIESLESRPCAN